MVVLASSAAETELDHYLDVLKAHGLVDHTVTSDDVEKTKPTPDIFTVALGKLDGLDPTEVIVVGDTPYDIEAAGKAGRRLDDLPARRKQCVALSGLSSGFFGIREQ